MTIRAHSSTRRIAPTLAAFAGAALCHAAIASAQPAPSGDTIAVEVGSGIVDGRVYKPHRARVRIHLGGPTGPVTNEWMNELTLGDSAGRPVMRWVTTSLIGPQKGSTLRQTYDAVTLAPIAYLSEQTSGAHTQFRIEGKRVVGRRRTANDTTMRPIDITLDRLGFIASASDLLPAAVGFRRGGVITAPMWGPNMAAAEGRIFTMIDTVRIEVEGTPQVAWKVEERRQSDRTHLATWYLTDRSPYMVAGEIFLPDGRMQYASEVAVP